MNIIKIGNSTENPLLSVVIPTYERPNDLRICLNSLSKDIQLGSPSYEIIVSDDSKSDSSRILIEKDFPHVHWGEGKKIGPAGNRNSGVNRAKGEWIVFLDDDCIAEEGYLNAYSKAIKANPDVQVLEGRIFADRPRRTWAEGCPENEQGGMLWTSNLCVRRKLFMEMGGLDEKFQIAYEDVDFALRLKQKGIQSIFVSEAAVCHPWRTLKQEGNNWKRAGYQFQELLIFLEKHPDQYPVHSPKVFLRNALRAIIKEIPLGYLMFMGKGTLFKVQKTFQSLYCAFIVYRFRYRAEFFNHKKIIFLAKTSWDYYLHPYRTLYAKELSKIGNEVFWINEPTKNPFNFIGQFFSGSKLANKVMVFTPLLFSPTLHNLSSLNAWMLRIQLFILCGTLNSKNVVLWSVYCEHHRIVSHYPDAFSIYWPGDLFDLNNERKILNSYDLIMPLTEESILKLKEFYSGKSFLSTTGCDWKLFDQEFHKSTKTNYKGRNKPIVGYVGNISSFRLDFEILKELVSNSKNWDFTFYGPIEQDRDTLKSVDNLSSFENCKFAGELNYDQVPAAIASFSAGIIPYKLNKFNFGTNPNKFFEYSAMGVPCISSRIPSLQKFSDFIIFADSAKDWIHGIKKSINSSKVNVDDLRKVAFSHSPKESLKRLEETILKT